MSSYNLNPYWPLFNETLKLIKLPEYVQPVALITYFGLFVEYSWIIYGWTVFNMVLFKLTAKDPLAPELEEVKDTVGVLEVCWENDLVYEFIVGDIILKVYEVALSPTGIYKIKDVVEVETIFRGKFLPLLTRVKEL